MQMHIICKSDLATLNRRNKSVFVCLLYNKNFIELKSNFQEKIRNLRQSARNFEQEVSLGTSQILSRYLRNCEVIKKILKELERGTLQVLYL